MAHTQPNKKPGPPSRAESFLQLLELEKKLQMQRFQEQGPPTPDESQSGESSPEPHHDFSSRRRRESDYPPLSHQGQMTKPTTRRGSSTSSLSISIPPMPHANAVAVRSDSALVGAPPAKETRVKGVTFSAPEVDPGNDSDESSICNSPTWEGFKQQKAQKARKDQAKKKEAEIDKQSNKIEPPPNTLKKKQPNKLSKNAPREPQPPAQSRRSQSALEIHSHRMTAHGSDSEGGFAKKPAEQESSRKIKGRSFFANFRRGSRSSIDETPSNKSHRASAPVLQSPTADGVEDHKPMAARRPPQVQAVFTAAARAQASTEKNQPSSRSSSRPSSSSSHQRSQSFFSSAFNKLKGTTGKDSSSSETASGQGRREGDVVNEANDFDIQRPVASRDLGQEAPGRTGVKSAYLSPYQPQLESRSPGPAGSTFSFEPFDGGHTTGIRPFDRDAAIVEESRRHPLLRESNLSQEQIQPASSRSAADSKQSAVLRPRIHRPSASHGGNLSPPTTPSAIGRAITSDSLDNMTMDRTKKTVDKKPRPAAEGKSEKSNDYVSFITQSYAPPPLELRSPLDTASIIESFRQKEEEWEATHRVVSNGSASSARNPAAKESVQNSPEPEAKKAPKGTNGRDEAQPKLTSPGTVSGTPRTTTGFDAASASTIPSSYGTRPSGTVSNRSSTSDYDDAPQSPLVETTPERLGLKPTQQVQAPTHAHPEVRKVHSPEPIKPAQASTAAPRMERSSTAPIPLIPPRHSARSSEAGERNSLDKEAPVIDLSVPHFATMEGRASTSTLSTPRSGAFSDVIKEDDGGDPRTAVRRPIPPKAHSTHDLPSANFLPPLKHQPLQHKKAKGKMAGSSLPSSPLADPVDDLAKPPSLKLSQNGSATSLESTGLRSASGAYLQEARKIAPVPATSSRALRGPYAHKNASAPTIRNAGSPERPTEPIAKMLVECCSCKFFHDMPSRVYECMAKPDSFVEDRMLGVSAAITTTVKCPWCGHGMTTQCCAGYAAVVYLKEKLHGR